MSLPQDREEITVPPDGGGPESQPAWRRDFPIDWPQDHYVARRDFTRFLGLTSLAFAAGHLWIGFQCWLRRRRGLPPLKRIASLDALPVGAAMTFGYPGRHDVCLLLRPETDVLVAFSQKCTHLACAVVPSFAEGTLRCPCHEGFFDLGTGRPLAGPPRRPLPRIALEVRGRDVYATGIELRTK